jgi:c-di-GMP-binding flagellar brake protein YcgR
VNEFQTSEDQAFIHQLFQRLGTSGRSFRCWQKETAFEAKISSFNPKTGLAVSVSLITLNLKETHYFARLPMEDAFFFFELEKVQLWYDKKETYIQWKLPLQVFFVQRRTDLRCHLALDQAMWVRFLDPTLRGFDSKRRIKDISAGGLQICATFEDRSLLPVGALLPQLAFSIGGKKITTAATIRHGSVRETKDGIFYFLGVQFSPLSQPTKAHIQTMVERLLSQQYSHVLPKE